jgi:hypothetical protein
MVGMSAATTAAPRRPKALAGAMESSGRIANPSLSLLMGQTIDQDRGTEPPSALVDRLLAIWRSPVRRLQIRHQRPAAPKARSRYTFADLGAGRRVCSGLVHAGLVACHHTRSFRSGCPVRSEQLSGSCGPIQSVSANSPFDCCTSAEPARSVDQLEIIFSHQAQLSRAPSKGESSRESRFDQMVV